MVMLLLNKQRQHSTLHIQKNVLPYALVTVPRVSRCCERFPGGFDLNVTTQGAARVIQKSIFEEKWETRGVLAKS